MNTAGLLHLPTMIKLSIAAVLILATAHSAGGAAVDGTAIRHARDIGRVSLRPNQGRPDDENGEYAWICPTVMCRSISDDCQLSEYIVLEYAYMAHGRLINVRCQSCPYCLDGPWGSLSRRKRSLYDVLGQTAGTPGCPQVTCPPLPEACDDVRLTDVIVRGRRCEQCPACYDNTVIGHHPNL